MAKYPDRLSIDKNTDRDLYDALKEDIFEGTTRKQQFFFAMAFGYLYNVRVELETTEGFFLAKDMGPEDESIISALAIAETDSVVILANQFAIYKIAEEYAHGGIRILYDEVTSKQPGSFYKRFEKEIFGEIAKHIEKKN